MAGEPEPVRQIRERLGRNPSPVQSSPAKASGGWHHLPVSPLERGPEPDGDALLQRAAVGDRDAFAELYRRHSTRVAAFFYRRTFCPDTSSGAHRGDVRPRHRRRTPIRCRQGHRHRWLFGIANKVLLEWIRRGNAARTASKRLGLQVVPLQAEELERVEEVADAERFRASLVDVLCGRVQPSARP